MLGADGAKKRGQAEIQEGETRKPALPGGTRPLQKERSALGPHGGGGQPGLRQGGGWRDAGGCRARGNPKQALSAGTAPSSQILAGLGRPGAPTTSSHLSEINVRPLPREKNVIIPQLHQLCNFYTPCLSFGKKYVYNQACEKTQTRRSKPREKNRQEKQTDRDWHHGFVRHKVHRDYPECA